MCNPEAAGEAFRDAPIGEVRLILGAGHSHSHMLLVGAFTSRALDHFQSLLLHEQCNTVYPIVSPSP